MAVRSVWIARHASRLDFADPDWARRAARPHDPPLSPAGRREAAALAARLAGEPIVRVVSSPFLRCVETAHAVAARRGVALLVEPGLSEWLNPAWFPRPPELLPTAALARAAPELDPGYAARGAARYGESGDAAVCRSARVARRLVAELAGDLLLVGHGASVLGAALGLLGAERPPGADDALRAVPCASLVQLVAAGPGWRLARCGDVAHLRMPDPGAA